MLLKAMRYLIKVLVFIIPLLVSVPALSNPNEAGHRFEDWVTITTTKPCYAATSGMASGAAPEKATIYIMLNAGELTPQILLQAPNWWRRTSTTTVTIGQQRWTMQTDYANSTPLNQEANKDMLLALIPATTLNWSGYAGNGGIVTYTFSLRGLTRAYQALMRTCKPL